MATSPPSARPLALPSYADELRTAQQQSIRAACLLASPLLLSFALLDLVVVPDAWRLLLALRVVCSTGIALLGWRLGGAPRSVLGSLSALIMLVIVPIEAGVLLSGGASSAYVAAGLLPMAGAALLVPLGPGAASVICAEVIVAMLGPVVLTDLGELWAVVPAASYLACMSILAIVGAVLQDRLRRREHQLRHEAGRQAGLVNLGMLAGGLAHELASPLSVASLEIDRMVRHPELSRLAADRLGPLNRAVARMTSILAAMRRGARLSDGSRRPVSIADEVGVALTLLNAQVRGKIEIVSDFGELPPVHCQPTLLGQVLVNLLLNACHALEGVGAPRIVVRLRSDAERAIIEIEDNGPGVPEALRQLIFEPLFTTKGERGNGLGLWLSAEIARSHEGELTVHVGAQGGALFRLSLPLDASEKLTTAAA